MFFLLLLPYMASNNTPSSISFFVETGQAATQWPAPLSPFSNPPSPIFVCTDDTSLLGVQTCARWRSVTRSCLVFFAIFFIRACINIFMTMPQKTKEKNVQPSCQALSTGNLLPNSRRVLVREVMFAIGRVLLKAACVLLLLRPFLLPVVWVPCIRMDKALNSMMWSRDSAARHVSKKFVDVSLHGCVSF